MAQDTHPPGMTRADLIVDGIGAGAAFLLLGAFLVLI